MSTITRRQHLQSLVGVAGFGLASPALQSPQVPGPKGPGRRQTSGAIPREGIGRRIRHLAYSDVGGRPDTVQIMMNRRHLYVGHMFANGLTVLDAADPRRLKPVGFFTGGDFTRTHHMQVADDMMLLANG